MQVKILRENETNIDSTDIWRFCFHSGYPTFKIAESGSHVFTIPAGSNNAHWTITHNLGYNPIYFANILRGTKSYQIPADMDTDIEVPNQIASTSVIRFYSMLVDSNTLEIGAYTSDGENVLNDESFTAYWIINLDEF